jgi:hypothetical protein
MALVLLEKRSLLHKPFTRTNGDAKRDRVYCATALMDIVEEPARLKPAANR